MPNEERERLSRRVETLRRLFDNIADSRARDAIAEEIAKHEALIVEMDNTAAPLVRFICHPISGPPMS
jgi:hypothetical protein